MPKISEFFGIIIRMRYDDHPHPHFHVFYGEDEASYRISPLKQTAGYVSTRINRMIMEWARKHREELLADWEAAVKQEPPMWIEGLE